MGRYLYNWMLIGIFVQNKNNNIMKKKQSKTKRCLGNRFVSNRRSMIYVDVSDGVYRTSIGGDKIPMECLRNARACVKSQQGPSSLIVQSKKAGAFVSLVEARTLSATIAERTGLRIPEEILRKALRGIYPPLGVVKNGEVVAIVKSLYK